MRKKGFTLIELLAVIVILAIIALIATPVITGLIEETRMGAFKDSVSIALSSSDLYAATSGKDLEEGIAVTELDLKNNNFITGVVRLNNNKFEALNISDGRYCANGNLGVLTITKGECDLDTPAAPSIANNETFGTTALYTISATDNPAIDVIRYEYYLSDELKEIPLDQVPTGTSEQADITIDVESNYVYFRVVSSDNVGGYWADAINYIDAVGPELTNVDNSSSIIYLTIEDRLLGGYQITDVEADIASDDVNWIPISGSSYTVTYENDAGVYYIYMMDALGSIRHRSFEITFIPDTTVPVVTSIDTSTTTVHFTIEDFALSGYQITTTDVAPTSWNDIS